MIQMEFPCAVLWREALDCRVLIPRNGKRDFRNGVPAKTAERKAGNVIKRA